MRDAARLLALLAVAAAAPALSPKLSIRQLSHTAWTENGGEPLPALHAFAQTKDGYLWLATGAAHYRFDGLRFSRWGIQATGALPTRDVFHVVVARDNSIWLLSSHGLCRIQGSTIRNYAFPWERASVHGPFEDSSGSLWMAVETESESYVQSLAPESGLVRRYGPPDGVPKSVRSMALDGEAFWLGSEGAVCRWVPGAAAICRPAEGAIHSLAAAGPGVVYAASSLAVYRGTPAAIQRLPVPAPVARSLQRRVLLVDRQGTLWAGSTGGLLRIRDSELETFSRKDGLSGEFVIGILEDAEGDVWVATSVGIDRFRNPRVLHISTPEGLSGEFVTTLKAARDGSVWIGALGHGLNRIQGSRITQYGAADGLPGDSVTAIEEDASGRLWVACGANLAWWGNGRFVPLRLPPGSREIFALSSDAHGRMWAAGYALWRISGGGVERVEAGQPPDLFRVFASRSGPLWIGSYNHGVVTLAPAAARVSPSIAGLNTVAPRSFLEDSGGAVWVATGALLNRVRDGKVTTWGPAQGLAAGEIYGLTIDRRGNLWLATSNAAVRVALSDLGRSPDSNPLPATFIRLDESDGLRMADRGGMPYPRIATAADGRVWLCARDGVAILDPEIIRQNTVPPPVVIEQLTVDGVVQTDPAPRFRGRQLQIAYTANSLMAPERIRFRYRFEGGVPIWTEAQGRRELTFVDLPPGNYRFHVSACNLDDVCNEAGAVTQFVVMPYYYQTLWFKFLLSALAWALIWGGYKLRMRQLDSRYRLIAEDRARVTREIHDSLLQGFAGVVLQLDAAARLFHSNPAASKDRLDRALNQADDSLREARQMLLDLRLPVLEGRPLSEALAEIGSITTRGTPITFSLKIRGNERPLAYTSQVALYLIGREAVRNAVNHANPSRITATLAFEDRECSLRVQDDGCGFDLEEDGRKPGHLGVQGMRERAAEAGATFRIETAPGAGTTVEVVTPYKVGRPPRSM